MKNKKRLILVSGQKGGVGKSTFCRILLDSLRRRGLTVAAYDGDGAIGHLLQHYGSKTKGVLDRTQSPLVGVGHYDLRDRRSREGLLESLHTDASVLLHDLPAGALSSIEEAVDVSGQSAMALVDAARQMGFATTVVIVINTDQASAKAVVHTLRSFGERARYVVVKNLNACTLDDFIVYNGFEHALGDHIGGEARRAARDAKAVELVMPEIFRTTAVKIDLWSLRYQDAAQDQRMHIQDKLRISQWMQLMDRQIEQAGRRLGVET
jgi:hypothetical protein